MTSAGFRFTLPSPSLTSSIPHAKLTCRTPAIALLNGGISGRTTGGFDPLRLISIVPPLPCELGTLYLLLNPCCFLILQASGSTSSRCRHTADEETTDGTPWRRRLLLCAAQPPNPSMGFCCLGRVSTLTRIIDVFSVFSHDFSLCIVINSSKE